MIALLLTVVLAPLLAALVIALAGRRLPANGGWLAVAGPLVSGIALLFLAGAGAGASVTWFTAGGLDVTLGLRVDGLGWWTAMVVAWVTALVNLYGVGYVAGERGRVRFFAWMAFFAGAMLTLVLSASLALLFVAWEAVGLASFALIAQRWHEREARRAATKALLVTRLGDMGLLLGWLLVLVVAGTTDIERALRALSGEAAASWTGLVIALLFLAAAAGKSAQLPLSAWLPAAMLAPTPVSALIHSATMVAAGVYLVLRLFPLFVASGALPVVLWLGAVTALAGAVVATAETDLKRVLAWSTVSQLGAMMLALGLGAPLAAALHLTTHAAYKSTLFLAAGVVERATGERGLERLGGLARGVPWAALAFAAAGLALAGFPLLSGYWSEERILHAAAARHPGWAMLVIALIALGAVYVARAGTAAFARWPGAPSPAARAPGPVMLAPALVLALAAVVVGWLSTSLAEQALPFAPTPGTPGAGWRIAAITASLAGLGYGAWRVHSRGPVAALGAWPGPIAVGLDGLLTTTARTAERAAASARGAERGLDRTAEIAAGAVRRTATSARGIDASFDRAAHAATAGTLAAARAAARAEDDGVWRANDRVAEMLGRAGAALRGLETGRLYLYTSAIAGFVFAASVLAIVSRLVAGARAGVE